MITPIIVPWITLRWGWRAAFLVTGSLGFIWLSAWLMIYRPPQDHARCTDAELAHIRSDPPEPMIKVSWLALLRHRQTWAFAHREIHDRSDLVVLSVLAAEIPRRPLRPEAEPAGGAPLIVIYLLADVGSVFGGWLSGRADQSRLDGERRAKDDDARGRAADRADDVRAGRSTNLWVATVIVGVAAAAHQWWSANIFTLPSDMFPRGAVGSVVGIGGFFGAVGGVLFQQLTGWILQHNGKNYTPIFIVCGSAYVVALLVIHLLVPRLRAGAQ